MNNKSYNKNLEYFDIDLKFRHWDEMSRDHKLEWDRGLTGDVIIAKDISHVSSTIGFNQSIRNIVLTNIYERPFDKDFGGNMYYSLFENIDDYIMSTRIKESLIKLINKYEPRIDLLNIKIFNDNKYAMNNNKVDIIITYAIPTFDGTFSVSFPIERIR